MKEEEKEAAKKEVFKDEVPVGLSTSVRIRWTGKDGVLNVE